jgi:tetratricopeptide (TPR) repeat protein
MDSAIRWITVVAIGAGLLGAVGGCASQPAQPEHANGTPVTTAQADANEQPDEFEKGANRAPSAQTLYRMAQIMTGQGRDPEAEYVLRRIIKEYKEYVPAYCALAESQMRGRRVDEAIVTLQAGLKVLPKEAILHNDIGMCRLMKKEYAAALKCFTDSAAIAPHDARFRANMAMTLGLMGRYEESLNLYLQVLTPADAHYNLGVVCEARKDTARAEKEFRKAKDLTDQAEAPSASVAAPPGE